MSRRGVALHDSPSPGQWTLRRRTACPLPRLYVATFWGLILIGGEDSFLAAGVLRRPRWRGGGGPPGRGEGS